MKTMKPNRFEAVFDILYLMTALIIGVWLLAAAKTPLATLFGVMALTLGAGDAFHLVPRAASAYSAEPARYQKALGTGKRVTSISMTVFYVLLYHAALLCFGAEGMEVLTWVVYALAAVRIILCLLPQNRWAEDGASAAFNIWRNVPFTLLGLCVGAVFFVYRKTALPQMWLAVLLSFAFYLPVVLWAKKAPWVGMLMLPKTCAYIWMLAMGFSVL